MTEGKPGNAVQHVYDRTRSRDMTQSTGWRFQPGGSPSWFVYAVATRGWAVVHQWRYLGFLPTTTSKYSFCNWLAMSPAFPSPMARLSSSITGVM